MSAHSPEAAVMIPVAAQENQTNWWSWLQHVALATNQIMQWCNQPRLVPMKVDTLPREPLDGMIAFVTDDTAGGPVVGGGTNKRLVWYADGAWRRFSA